MSDEKINMQASDGWLLMACLMGAKGSTLRSIISTGDMLNHDIFSLDELNGGFRRLEMAGLIYCREGRYHTAEAAKRLFNVHAPANKDFISQQLALQKYFAGLRLPQVIHGNGCTCERITQADFDKAYSKAREDFAFWFTPNWIRPFLFWVKNKDKV